MDKDVIELLNAALNRTDYVSASLTEFCELFYADDRPAALSKISSAADSLDWLINAMDVIYNLKNEVFDLKKVTDIIAELNECLENNDFVLLADIVEYEVVPLLNKWNGEIKSFLAES